MATAKMLGTFSSGETVPESQCNSTPPQKFSCTRHRKKSLPWAGKRVLVSFHFFIVLLRI